LQCFRLQRAFADVGPQLAAGIIGGQADEGEIAGRGLPFYSAKAVFLAQDAAQRLIFNR
jgi:hypothetical protein